MQKNITLHSVGLLYLCLYNVLPYFIFVFCPLAVMAEGILMCTDI